MVARFAPGLVRLLGYRFGQDFRYDLFAGLSVAAVAVPVAVAYAELAGFSPVVGLYSCILPLVAYAIFGTSRQLIVNPDAATCAMLAAAVAPLAAGDAGQYASLTFMLTLLTGFFCIVASFLRLGVLADFLSRPILIGFLNGIALSIILGQIGKLFGFPIESGRIIPRLVEFIQKAPQTHFPTLAVGLGSFALLVLSKRFLARVPAALVTMAVAAIASAVLGLEQQGVAVLGPLQAGLPRIGWTAVPLEQFPALTASAAGLAVVLFSSGIVTARSFAARNGYTLDDDKEFAAFGAANIASAFSQGFAVTGADSRTAMGDAAGGRTQMTGLVAAAAIAIVLVFLTEPMRFVPLAALGAVLVSAGFSLFNVRSLRWIWRFDRREVVLSVITMLGVVAFGAINGIMVAVILAVIRFIRVTARPRCEVLGRIEGMPGFHSVERHPTAATYHGIVIFRFNGPITFFNAPFFKQSVLVEARKAGSGLRWIIIDTLPITTVDVTGVFEVQDLRDKLFAMGVGLIYAGRATETLAWLRRAGEMNEERERHFYPTIKSAVKACQSSLDQGSAGGADDSSVVADSDQDP